MLWSIRATSTLNSKNNNTRNDRDGCIMDAKFLINGVCVCVHSNNSLLVVQVLVAHCPEPMNFRNSSIDLIKAHYSENR